MDRSQHYYLEDALEVGPQANVERLQRELNEMREARNAAGREYLRLWRETQKMVQAGMILTDTVTRLMSSIGDGPSNRSLKPLLSALQEANDHFRMTITTSRVEH